MESQVIAVGFDGTCVTHAFPGIGKDIGAVPVLKDLVAAGHKLILWTMRDGRMEDGNLQEAVDWFARNDIPLWGVNQSPGQEHWSGSPKAFAHVTIDDTALGCPLIQDPELSGRPYADWSEIRDMLTIYGLLHGREA